MRRALVALAAALVLATPAAALATCPPPDNGCGKCRPDCLAACENSVVVNPPGHEKG